MMSSLKKAAILTGMFTLFALLTLSAVCTGDDATKKNAKQRPQVSFSHEDHMGMGESGCLECHHKYENGENVLDDGELGGAEYEETMILDVNAPEDSSGYECATCHGNKTISKMSAMDAFHKQCIGCHEKEKKGPVLCGECHKRDSMKNKNANGEEK